MEYFVYGADKKQGKEGEGEIDDGITIINIHGSGLEAQSEKKIWESVCESLGVRGISISLPGFGYTDIKIGRSSFGGEVGEFRLVRSSYPERTQESLRLAERRFKCSAEERESRQVYHHRSQSRQPSRHGCGMAL